MSSVGRAPGNTPMDCGLYSKPLKWIFVSFDDGSMRFGMAKGERVVALSGNAGLSTTANNLLRAAMSHYGLLHSAARLLWFRAISWLGGHDASRIGMSSRPPGAERVCKEGDTWLAGLPYLAARRRVPRHDPRGSSCYKPIHSTQFTLQGTIKLHNHLQDLNKYTHTYPAQTRPGGGRPRKSRHFHHVNFELTHISGILSCR